MLAHYNAEYSNLGLAYPGISVQFVAFTYRGNMKLSVRLFLVVTFFAWSCAIALADSPRVYSPTSNLYGHLGLNTVPSSRMDKTGTLRIGVSHADPYVHTTIGYQATDRFYFGLRQTSEISDLHDDPDKVYPGLDLKFKLFEEKTFRPEISVGFQSAFGHKRMAGEYLSFSKRYENFDFTAGIGWGRFGTRNSIGNPLDWTGSYLDDNRQLDGDKPNGPRNWFKGDTGFFAGIEYATPLQGFSLKADISSDSYKAERASGQDGPAGYSLGVTYQPTEWADIGVAWMDSDTVMARLSFKSSPGKWPFKISEQTEFVPVQTDTSDKTISAIAKQHGFRIRHITNDDDNVVSGQLHANDSYSLPYQLGQSWRIMANKTTRNSPDNLKLEPIYFGLRGSSLTINRRDLANAWNNKGSAEEIWRNLSFDDDFSNQAFQTRMFLPRFTLRETFSLSEDDAPLLHRTDLLASIDQQVATNFLLSASLRYNLFSNINHINQTRLPADDAVRSDIPNYLVKKFAIERAYLQGFKSLSTDWHVMAGGGYIEEIFAGYHGEILYRPWGHNWAAGFEAAHAIKRDYETALNLGFLGDSAFTGHANFYYEIPDTNMTFQASAGQYLAKDKGGTLSLKNRFINGSTIEAFVTATNMSDPDAYGASSAISSGLRFTLPLGSLKYIPHGSGIDINAEPIGRDAGQRLNIEHNLYDMTDNLSYRRLVQSWADVTK